MTIREFWRRTYTLPRIALACAGLAALLNIGSYLGLSLRAIGGSVMALHGAVLILGLVLVGRTAQERVLAVWRRGSPVETDPLPRRLIWAAGGAAVYMVALIVGVAVIYGEGHAEVRDGREVWIVGNSVARSLPPGTVEAFSAVRAPRRATDPWRSSGRSISPTAAP